MDTATSRTGPMPPGADLLVCLAAIARALQAEFQPGTFLDDLSAALHPSSPTIVSVSVISPRTGERFRCLPSTAEPDSCRRRAATRPTSSARHAFRSPTHRSRPCSTDTCCTSRTSWADPGFVRQRDSVKAAGLRSAVIVPVMAGSRVIGELSAASRLAAAYDDVHVERLRTVGHMIGPFIDVIALLIGSGAGATGWTC